jgi:hypothetical protein
MLGYVVSTRIGAVIYNIFHHKALSLTIMSAGYYSSNELIMLVSIILFSHSTLELCFDIMLLPVLHAGQYQTALITFESYLKNC